MTWVKVCGLRRRQDVAVAVETGADAIGLVLAAGSPRQIDQAQARELARDVPALSIIVTTDLTPSELMAAAEFTGVRGVQPHGAYRREAAREAKAAGLFVLMPVPVRNVVDLSGLDEGHIPLLDTFRDGVQGGTGETFDWELIKHPERDFVLAGGLGPHNVDEVVRVVAPWGVDASSGLESAPGMKDQALIREYVERAKGR